MGNIRFSEKTAALREFFASVNGGDLKKAAADISKHFDLPLDTTTDWTEAEYEFNRLFVGPSAVSAPPYASAYENTPTLMGKSTLEVRNAYRVLGLAVPDRGATPDDHIAYELDAVLAFEAAVASGDNKDVVELRKWFLSEHMGEWVPKFNGAIKAEEGAGAPFVMVVDALSIWLAIVETEACLSN
jgi:TorA maturation chaperone TorD